MHEESRKENNICEVLCRLIQNFPDLHELIPRSSQLNHIFLNNFIKHNCLNPYVSDKLYADFASVLLTKNRKAAVKNPEKQRRSHTQHACTQ